MFYYNKGNNYDKFTKRRYYLAQALLFQDNIAFLSSHGCLHYKLHVSMVGFYDKESFVSRKTKSMKTMLLRMIKKKD